MPADPLPPEEPAGLDGARPARSPRRRWLSSLRLRYTVTATVFAAAAFATGGAVALTFYHDGLAASIDHDVHTTANGVASAAQRSPLPDPIPMPVAAGVPRVQVIDAAGKVVSGDPVSADAPPMLALAQGKTGHVVSVSNPANLPERRAAVLAIRVSGPAGPLTVVVAGSLDPADDSTRQAVRLSAILGVISLAAIGTVAWLTVGRTLRRVERLRSQVATVTASGDLGRRVPETGTDELAGLGLTMNEMLEALERSAERQRRFVADAAHELRTPIAGLSASLEVAVSHPEITRDRSWIGELADGHRRLGRLVNDLLVLASLEGDAPKRRDPVDLAGVVADATRRPVPPGVRLRAGRVDRAIVPGDATQLTRVVTNLVDNALRYARGTVDVTLKAQGAQAVISVADDGPGIAPADRERIWDRFVRLDDDRSRTSGGTGLGLALVRELVTAHGGTVSVTGSADWPGAVFIVCLPLISGQSGARQP